MASNRGRHFVLVHGACHGAWTWYKLKPRLESAGHRVTALDLAASGIHGASIHGVTSLLSYTEPLLELMASVPPEGKVILVGHSLGGMSLALAMDRFPEKISVAVFVTAVVPGTRQSPAYLLEKFLELPVEYWEDTQFWRCSGDGGEVLTTMGFGQKFLRCKLYTRCSGEDLALAEALMRPGSLFIEDLRRAEDFSEEGYGSVRKVFVICGMDMAVTAAFQRWMIGNTGVERVVEMAESDHMPMLSMPAQLCRRLLEIAEELPN